MALTLEKIGLKNGPPNPDWYFNSPARPWNDGKPLIQKQISDNIKNQETNIADNNSETKDKLSPFSVLNKGQSEDILFSQNNKGGGQNSAYSLKETNILQFKDSTEDKPETTINLHDLSKAQLKLIQVIFLLTKNTNTKTTPPVEIELLANQTGLNISTIKKTIQRLEVKGLLKRVAFKNGRGGWSQYNLAKNLEDQLKVLVLKDKLETFTYQSKDISTIFKKEFEISEKLLSVENKVNTLDFKNVFAISDYVIKNLPKPWCYLNFNTLNIAGLTAEHLYYLFYQGKLSAAQIQINTDFFLADLVFNNTKDYLVKWSNFVNMIFNGYSYNFDNIDMPNVINFTSFFNSKHECNSNKNLVIDEISDFLLEEWINSLPINDKIKLLEEKNKNKNLEQQREFLKSYFLKTHDRI